MTPTPLALRRRPLRAALTTAAAAGVLAALAAAAGDGRALRLVVTDERGGTVISRELPSSGRYAIDYQHSYYDQPATEEFAADGARFHLASLSSPSEAVLDYYELPGTRSTTDSGAHLLVPDAPPAVAELPLIATAKGRRTLVVDGRRYPLYAADGEARHVLLRLAPESRLRRLLSWRA